ncbi:glycosyltransferase family 4 protein [Mycobacterium sp. M1]|uniref:Glycosyltransferase family 4 protein n=1 Tax=Mycolicibacter acidiphilus TaxID=2835306 RepID=A0ABS5RGT9_9MYCO|nr:glycosyltransferase family 4 protein [Mycolicibacter acidiphilus]MBS9533507.1 glycosyltransferase family 4 protein [Mycolicibacter acidiphilus]
MLWLSPWVRGAARVMAEELIRRGADVLLVTTDAHPGADAARDYELVLDTRLRTASSWPPLPAAWRRIRRFNPDVVIAEMVRDPRWIALAGRTPRIQLIHDDAPHDPIEHRPGYERAVFDRWGAHSAATVTFSDYVAQRITERRDVAGTPVRVAPLCSDLDAELVPPFVDADGRRDFVMIGRLNPYKNVDVVLAAWERHVAGEAWRGDELVFIGGGSAVERSMPKHTRVRPGGYRYVDIVGTVAAAKGSIVHHRRASQSGVQVVSMQLGVMPIASTAGGLSEYQPVECPPVGVDDVAGLAALFDELGDPETAAARGAAAARDYAQKFCVDRFADRFLDIIAGVVLD